MKTFHQFMEQIPHMEPKPVDVMRARQNEINKRQHRRHVHGELAHTADWEMKQKNQRA